MFPLVKIKPKKIEDYQQFILREEITYLKELAEKISGLKIAHLNAVSQGGGVAEVLKGLVPLMTGLGLKTKWYTLPPDKDFFKVTKNLYNALQGEKFEISEKEKRYYKKYLRKIAPAFKNIDADCWIIHDSQPLGLVKYIPKKKKRIARIHMDTTQPNPASWRFISQYLKDYNRIIFSSEEFIKKDVPREKIRIITPAIDPLKPKNSLMDEAKAAEIITKVGINKQKPLISQVSRFDHWKDPLGVLKAFRIAKEKIPDLQLALVGIIIAEDDPAALDIYHQVKEAAQREKDIFLFSDLKSLGGSKIGDFVNALQTQADIVIQKSIREGFGLTVTEAMWKGKVVIAGDVGGIRKQIINDRNGFLVSSPEETAEKIIQLIKSPSLSKAIGQTAKETVNNKFLITRLLKDYLELINQTVKK